MPDDSNADATIKINAEIASKVNYAIAQWVYDTGRGNILSRLQIENGSENALNNCKLKLWSQPAFVSTRTWNIDRIEAGQSFDITDLEIHLDSGFLWDISEAVNGTVRFELSSDGLEPIEQSCPMRILAPTEWAGATLPMELLAAHVLPNDPQVAKILKIACGELSKAGREASLEGYQKGDPRRVVEVMEAIWGAVQSLGLSYAEPPASFEQVGQKIRTPSQIAVDGLATCLDTSTLFAACLEQAGIYSVLIIPPGHAFVGGWLYANNGLDRPVSDDASGLQKAVALHELVVFETTKVAASPPLSFQQAIALRSIPPQIIAVSVKQARMLGVAPLPQQNAARVVPGTNEANGGLQNVDWLSRYANRPGSDTNAPDSRKPPAGSRLDEWQKKLLDLSQRNSLLNFKAGKRAIPLACPDASALEDVLAGGHRLQVVPPPQQVLENNDDAGNIARIYQYAEQSLPDKTLIGLIGENELESRLTELMRSGKRDLEEGGANTLFLALGFLEWKDEKTRSQSSSLAPLILIPIALDRRNARSRVILSGLDEETRFNATLLQLLEQDYGVRIPELENELPKDSTGIDVELICQLVTNAVRHFSGWNVVNEAAISSFSFARYLMWKDLTEQGDLIKQNALVKHLVDTPLLEYKSDIPFPRANRLDHDYPPDKLFMPLPADSSQITAALAAASGKDFVLFGPPGTGKSQSIANMISHCLAEGKKVLFVSAKKAALDVVYRRLGAVGLDDFCLEVHSSKDSNRNAYEQLKRAAMRADAAIGENDWGRETGKLLAQITDLNNYVAHAHREYPNGLTAYRAIGKLLSATEVAHIALAWSKPDEHTRDDYEKMQAGAQGLMLAFPETVSPQTRELLAPIRTTEWSPSGEKAFFDTTQDAARMLLDFDRNRAEFTSALTTQFPAAKISSAPPACTALLKIAQELLDHQGTQAVILSAAQAGKLKADLDSARQILATIHSSWTALSGRYRPEAVMTLDMDEIQKNWRDAAALAWPRRTFAQKAVERTLQTATSEGQKTDPARDILPLWQWQKACRELAGFDRLKQETLGLWRGAETNTDEFDAQWTKALELGKTTQALCEQCSSDEGTREALQNAVTGILQGAESISAHQMARELVDSFHGLQPVLTKLSAVANAPSRELMGADRDGWIAALASNCERWSRSASSLRAWAKWQNERHQANLRGLAPLVEALEKGTTAPALTMRLFEINYLRWWLSSVIDNDTVLQSFNGREQQFTIEAFASNIDAYLNLTQRYIQARIALHHQAQVSPEDDAAMGLLTRELKKKMRFKPLRKMMNQASSAVLRLTPCMMMSPLSVAQFLALGKQLFDVVIFDEASQIPVWDSIGALARGKQVVIAGDPKQMPPTDFFSRGTDEDDDEIELQSAESILDECRSARVPELYLDWHYRSRYENLIAFSNHHYYEDRLVTFPAPQTSDSSVSFHYVADGIYAGGKSRHNQVEAKAVVADVVAHLRAPLVGGKKLSVGVVTFNGQQQKLIEDLLEAERRADPSLEQWFNAAQMEPVMVKNLENVQGDERDIMYFSVTFGPDLTGRLLMNFGPLNKDGGERRLNVAITRARNRLKVFSSMRPDQIDLARTGAIGVRDFKHFLEFAQVGAGSFASETNLTGHSFDSEFEEAVSYALEKRGWRVQSQVGVAKFRIDLGVVHPENPGRYLAGVECDGARYHSAATARDRDKVRGEVLRGLGWNILRVWSTDWWENPEGTADQLDGQLKELLQQASTPAAPSVDEPAQAWPVPDDEPADELPESNLLMPQVTVAPIIVPGPALPETALPPTGTLAATLIKSVPETPADIEAKPTMAKYRPFNFAELEIPPDAAQFDSRGYDAALLAMIEKVVAQEGPILEDLLVRKIARAHGISRATARIQKRIQALVQGKFHTSSEGHETVYWPSRQAQEQWCTFRQPGDGPPRTVADIPLAELRVLANIVSQQSTDRKLVLIFMAKNCGIARIGENVRARFDEALS